MIYSTFNEYLTKPKSLTFEEMEEIHDMILADIAGDIDGKELYEELIQTAVRYAGIRAEWCLMDREKKAERDSGRTACHDSVIVKFNMLARYLKMQGRDNGWRDKLGYEEEDKLYRKKIGDFACYLVFVNSINSR